MTTQSRFDWLDGVLKMSHKRMMSLINGSAEIRDELKRSDTTRELDDGKFVRLIKSSGDAQEDTLPANNVSSDEMPVMTYYELMGLCSARLLRAVTGEKYDWTTRSYVQGAAIGIDLGDGEKPFNRLASKINIPPDNKFYWFYTVGIEHAFDWFPCEVIAVTFFKVEQRERLGLKDKSKAEIFAYLKKQLKRRKSENDDMIGFLNSFDSDRIEKVYNEFCRFKTRNETAAELCRLVKELFMPEIKEMMTRKNSRTSP